MEIISGQYFQNLQFDLPFWSFSVDFFLIDGMWALIWVPTEIRSWKRLSFKAIQLVQGLGGPTLDLNWSPDLEEFLSVPRFLTILRCFATFNQNWTASILAPQNSYNLINNCFGPGSLKIWFSNYKNCIFSTHMFSMKIMSCFFRIYVNCSYF